MSRRLLKGFGAAAGAALAVVLVAPAPARAGVAAPSAASAGPNQSNNWAGYNEFLNPGSPYQSISATWTVPTATQHAAGQAESSATWVGIGGGCLTSNCAASDETLVQAGTEQDVSSTGAASYYAWWEVIPAPSVEFSGVTIHPGDSVSVSLTQAAPEVWDIALDDLTDGQSGTASQTIPYPSDYSTAEFIEETPVSVGTSGAGLSDLPNLTTVAFRQASVNGASAGLTPAEEIELVDSSGQVIALPSAPNGAGNGFNLCAWATSCPAPGSGPSASGPRRPGPPGSGKPGPPAPKPKHP